MTLAEWAADPFIASYWLVYGNFVFFLAAFLAALYLNFNFNTVLVGLIYLIPMTPLGLHSENAVRVHLVSFENLIYGLIELAVFVVTVRKTDLTFDRQHVRQLFGHTLPIAAALMGLSFVSRMTVAPVTRLELILIAGVFLAGAVMRVLAIRQLGGTGFKFDIVFRDEQKLKIDQLYGYMRHPSYTAMMLVILAYAMTTHNVWAGAAGMLAAWFGFQFRIHSEEKALAVRFGEAYSRYRATTGMWLPKWKNRQPGGPGGSRSRSRFGRESEAAATAFLEKKGYRILQRNFRCRAGEIDIIAEHRDAVVFVEVKARSGGAFGPPLAALTPQKQRKLVSVAKNFLAAKKVQNRTCRFDVVAVAGKPDRPDLWKIELFQDAFRADV